MGIEFEVSEQIPATQESIYEAWLNSSGHSKMTGSPADVSSVVGESFEAWDGYITGKNLELEFSKRIIQRWRTVEFEDSDEDSYLEILFEAEGKGTRVTIIHTNLPKHGMQYRQGWIDAYFVPMKDYFGGDVGEKAA
jgi:activator of HSP90 ATPase